MSSRSGWAVAAALAWLLGALAAAQQAPPNDGPFEEFFLRFVAEKPFRLDRVSYPLTVRIGDARVGEVRSESWARKQVQSDMPVPLTAEELKTKGLEQRIKRQSGTRVDVMQFRLEGERYMVTYTFQRLKGRWFLTRFDNATR